MNKQKGRSTRDGIAQAGMKSAPEQMAQKAERLKEPNGRKLVREGTKVCEGKGRKVSLAFGVELLWKKNTLSMSVICTLNPVSHEGRGG